MKKLCVGMMTGLLALGFMGCTEECKPCLKGDFGCIIDCVKERCGYAEGYNSISELISAGFCMAEYESCYGTRSDLCPDSPKHPSNSGNSSNSSNSSNADDSSNSSNADDSSNSSNADDSGNADDNDNIDDAK